MKRLPCVLAAVLPFALAIAACSPVTRTYENTGGAGTSTSTSTTGTGVSTGGGGAGGSAPKASCTAPHKPFSILLPSDLGGSINDQPVVVADPGTPDGHALVHVVVSSNGQNAQTFLRSVANSDSQMLGPVVTQSAPQFTPASGWVTPGTTLFLQGFQGAIPGATPLLIGQLAYPLDQYQGLMPSPAPTFTPYLTPSDCTMGGYVNHLLVSQDPDGTDVHYLVSCGVGTDGASLWVGSNGPNTPPAEVVQGMKADPAQNPSVYTYTDNTHFAAFLEGSMSNPSGFYGYGSATALGTLLPLQLQSGEGAVPVTLAPNTVADGFTFFVASLDAAKSTGSIWGGTVTVDDLPMLADTPPPTLHPVVPTAPLMSLAGLGTPTADATSLYMAGAPLLTNNGVNFTWTKLDGTPLVVEQQVYTTTNTVTAAAAAPFGLDQALVVWIEEDSSSNFTVWGLQLVCTTN